MGTRRPRVIRFICKDGEVEKLPSSSDLVKVSPVLSSLLDRTAPNDPEVKIDISLDSVLNVQFMHSLYGRYTDPFNVYEILYFINYLQLSESVVYNMLSHKESCVWPGWNTFDSLVKRLFFLYRSQYVSIAKSLAEHFFLPSSIFQIVRYRKFRNHIRNKYRFHLYVLDKYARVCCCRTCSQERKKRLAYHLNPSDLTKCVPRNFESLYKNKYSFEHLLNCTT